MLMKNDKIIQILGDEAFEDLLNAIEGIWVIYLDTNRYIVIT
jgi:hypothetical protein